MKTPELPPLLVKKSPSAYYVYVYKNKWDSEKKRSYRAEQRKVGTILGKEKEGMVRWSPEFIKEHPELKFFDCERKDRKWIFTPYASEEGLSLKQALQVRKIHAGATWALDQIVNNSPMGKALAKTFQSHKDYLRILSLVYFLVLNENNDISRYETFAERTRLPWPQGLSPSAINRLFARISPQQIESFLNTLNEEWKLEKQRNGNSPQVLAFDSSTISNHPEQLVRVARGKNKGADDLSQIIPLLFVDAGSGMPVSYREFEGNISEVFTFRRMITDISRSNLKDVILVTDKEKCSNNDIDECLRNDVNFIFNMKCGGPDNQIQKIINETREDLHDLNNRDWFTQVSCVVRKANRKYERTPVNAGKALNREDASLYWYVYFDEKTAGTAANLLKERIDRICQKFEEDKPLDENEQKLFKEVFIADEQSGSYRIDNEKINARLACNGCSVLLSNVEMSPRNVWADYQDRAAFEEFLNTLKSRSAGSLLSGSGKEFVRGELFVQFLAASVMIMVRRRIKAYAEDSRIKGKLQVRYQSGGRILSELNNVMQTQFKGCSYFPEIDDKKKKFFEAVGVPAPDAEPEEQPEMEDTDPDTAKSEVVV